jgi:thioredoxin reductase (NADPH)
MYDVLIIGLGCAGYTSAIYAARYKLSVFLVGQEEGGMGVTAAEVGNWPGDIEVKGPDLMQRMKEHAESFESVTTKIGLVEKVQRRQKAEGRSEDSFLVMLSGGEEVEARSIIFATGSNKRHLGVPGEEEFAGRGVTYCATCDAFFYKGKTVAVIGGGDSAVEGAAIAAQVAERVYLIHRRDAFRAEPFWLDEVKKRENITFVLNTNVMEIVGDTKVTGVQLDTPFEGQEQLAVDGVFIEIGATPATALAKDLGCDLDDGGYLKVGPDQSSSIKGVFGAGDVTNASNHFAQFATAAGEGAVAANSVFNYLQGG